MKYAIVNNQTKVVENIILLDEITSYHPADGYKLVKIVTEGGIGWKYNRNKFSPPVKECEQLDEDALSEIISQERKARYKAETDGLFFKWQAGEIEKGEWLDARQRIKKELPKNKQ